MTPKSSLAIVRLLTVAVVVLNAGGNYFLSLGVRPAGELISLSPLDYIVVLGRSWVPLGIALLIGWMISQLSLLSWADLSYVLPVTSVSYVLAAILGAVSLHERVSLGRWSGIALIVAGVVVVGRTAPRTTPTPVEVRR